MCNRFTLIAVVYNCNYRARRVQQKQKKRQLTVIHIGGCNTHRSLTSIQFAPRNLFSRNHWLRSMAALHATIIRWPQSLQCEIRFLFYRRIYFGIASASHIRTNRRPTCDHRHGTHICCSNSKWKKKSITRPVLFRRCNVTEMDSMFITTFLFSITCVNCDNSSSLIFVN